MFFASNAGKRSLALDLGDPRGSRRDAASSSTARTCFVLSLRPGLAERARPRRGGEVRERNPRLIYWTIGAFGRGGPLSSQPGYDPLMQAASGIMSVTGENDRPPVRAGVSLIDFATGSGGDRGRRRAVRARARPASAARSTRRCTRRRSTRCRPRSSGIPRRGRRAGPQGSAFAQIAPYEVFPTSDGAVMIFAGNDELWDAAARRAGLCRRRSLPHEPASRRAPRGAVRRDRGEDDCERERAPSGRNALTDAGVPVSPVHDLGEALAHPQTQALGILQHFGGGTTVNLPLRFDGERPRYSTAPPPGD